ncbi:cation transporting p-type atpase [Lactobacillus selangorensis]|uniref:Cation transporting P-type atpase n=1 Tax=Lactobacillus selangorensis TaxID=81857 RepID=A0A0R2FK64_9LACO|nr:cation-translocating P-type ATPase [Lactobacillus selangorensis]KRN29023.1 cation transporting p-type atpase [Lactobacillus selangorensis]KRN32567.1 cation transporting p-type atpase [Lactobacillus selangorensis]
MTTAHLTDLNTGLSAPEVSQRIANGQKNTAQKPLTRSVRQIWRDNLLTWFNLINLIIAAFIIYTGSYKNLLFLGVAIANTAIGIFQEVRSKRQIDKMALLANTPSTVLRDGTLQKIDQGELVQDDLLLLKRGDQIPTDGLVRQTQGLEVDESQLTGEALPIVKVAGDSLFSGSFLTSGQAYVQVTAVGSANTTSRLADAAKQEKPSTSVLLTIINRIIKVLTIIILPLGALLMAARLLHHASLDRAILGTAAAMVGMIPEGLVLLTSVALAVGALNLARQRVLVRTLPSIETLARVDVLCLDKTGTLTSGKLKLERFIPIGQQAAGKLQAAASAVVFTLNDDNETALAIKAAYPEHPDWVPTAQVPFSSARKWSGVSFQGQGSWIMGAPEFVLAHLSNEQQHKISAATQEGLRVLALVHSNETQLTTTLPADRQLSAILLISDELRPTAKHTLEYFKMQSVAVKIISGDDPETVGKIAARAGVDQCDAVVDMRQIDDHADYQKLVRTHTIFGRVTPTQKKKLIAAFQANGHTVAMTGDGVNDILALRQSDCGIAMASGSEATKSIADFVLLDSNFDAMIGVLNEGRRVINNIERVASLYLIKTAYSIILSLIYIFMAGDYPFQPIQLTPISALTVGIPSFFLALYPDYDPPRGKFMKNIMETALPAALCVVGYLLVIQWLGSVIGLNYATTSTLSVLVTGAICFSALIEVSRPFNLRKVLLVGVLMLCFVAVFAWGQQIFSLVNLFTWRLSLFAVLLLISAYPVFQFAQQTLGKHVFTKIHWKSN